MVNLALRAWMKLSTLAWADSLVASMFFPSLFGEWTIYDSQECFGTYAAGRQGVVPRNFLPYRSNVGK